MNSSTPLVSIIVPMYNSQEFIESTLHSILNQSYKNIELIIADDGSTDESSKKVLEFSRKDSRVSYYYQDNRGGSAARNLGFDNSKGEYIIYFDSDDTMNENSIEVLVKAIVDSNYHYDIVLGDHRYVNFEEEILNIKHRKMASHVLETIKQNPESKKDLFNLVYFNPIPGTKMIRKDFLVKNNIYFEDLKVSQDLNFYLKMIGYSPEILYVNKIIVNYKVRDGSVSRTFNKNILDCIKCFEIIEENQYSIYENNPKILSTLKYHNYVSKMLMIPMINNTDERKYVYERFKKELLKLNLADVDKRYVELDPRRFKFGMENQFLYTSTLLNKVYPLLAFIRKKLR